MTSGKARHRLVLFTDDGLELKARLDQVESYSYWRAANAVGGFKMVLKPDFDVSLIDVDHLIYFWRQAQGGEELCMCVGFCRKWGWFENAEGHDRFFVEGTDQLDLIDRRIIAYYANSDGESTMGYNADAQIQYIVILNMGAGAPLDEAGRPRAYDANYFNVMGYTYHGPVIRRSFAWRYVLPTIQEIAQSSRDLGYPLYFDVVPSADPAHFEFQTYIPYLGMNRGSTSAVPVIFSKEEQNLAEPRWEEDWFEERNYVYGGGQGEDDNRMIDPEDDVWRMHKSIWNRRECFQDAREEDTIQGVANKAYERMQRERPVVRFQGVILDTPKTRFGKDFMYGDVVACRYQEREFDAMIDAFRISVDETGEENLEIRTEVEYAFGWE